MGYSKYMNKYNEERTFTQIEALYKWKNNIDFPPIIVEVSPVGGCNQKCVFCYSDYIKLEDRFDNELLKETFIDLANFGVKAVLLQGTGEPLLHQGLPDAILEGYGKGLEFTLTTNGVLLTSKLQKSILKYF